jgi:hypothetical protein
MKLALVTTSPALPSEVGAAVSELLPHLRELCELSVFVEPGGGSGEIAGVPFAPIATLDPRAHDRLMIPIGNDPALAFAPRVVRALGGTVMLFDWGLFDLACAAYPALARGGLKGFAAALREGGLAQARSYARGGGEHGAASPGEPAHRPSFNRSIVRHADSFLVHASPLARRILPERNARTAIGVVPLGAAAPPDFTARRAVELLAEFPGPRATRGARIAFGALWTSGADAAR